MIKNKVKALWKLCFDDDETFIEMYFRLRYSNDINIAITSGEEIIAALQMLPYPMTFCGNTIQTSYISGACTHPEYRSNGVMRELLSQAFIRMMQNNVSISTLIPGEPWLFNYYTRLGYATVFYYSTEVLPEYCITTSADFVVEHTNEFEETVYEYVNEQMHKRACCTQHTAEDFKVILADLQTTHDTLYIARKAEKIVGVAIAYRNGDSLLLSEIFADNEEVKQYLLYQIRQTTKCSTITQIKPHTDNEEVYPLGMARIIDAKGVLQLYAKAYPEHEMNIELTDEQLSINNGYYYLCNGKCMYNKQRLPGAHLQLTIGELTEKTLAPLRPYMSLMLN